MKYALITGASRRLGLFLTHKLVETGWHVHALTRTASDELKKLSDQNITIHELKTYNEETINRFMSDIRKNNQPIDLLVNNASIFEKDEYFTRSGISFYEALTFIHMSLPALLVNGLHTELSQAGGNIVSITDIYADNPNQDYSLYCSTKAGLQNLTLGFAKKFAPKIRANCIQPGPIKFLDEHTPQYQKAVLNETLLPFEGGFEPIFKTLEFILDNPYITGECIKVDGGRSLVRG